MVEQILAASEPFPPHLHRHILQLYVIRHRRAPANEAERRRAVFEYLTRTRRDRSPLTRVHATPELCAWLEAPDERAKGWGPVPRLAALLLRFSRDLRRRFDLSVERDYKEFACYVALTVRSVLRWPDDLVGPTLRRVLWEPAPGVPSDSRVGVTRALLYVRRHASSPKPLDLRRPADLAQLLLSVLADVDEGRQPAYVLSPEQWDHLAKPVTSARAKFPLTGLLHHLLVERGMVRERDLARPDVAETLRREVPTLLARLRLPAPLREAHGLRIAPIAAAAPDGEPVPVVTVVGPVAHGSGLGAAARACVEAFREAGVPVEVLDHRAGWGRNDEGRGHARVERVRGDINVIHFNPDVLIENLSRYGFEQFEGRYNIGCFFWETSRATLAHRLGADLVDEIWVASEYCREIFQAVTDRPVVNVRTPVPRIEDVSWASRRYFGLEDGPFTYVFTFDGASRFTRKHPLGAVRAFQSAWPSDPGVRLVFKTQNTHLLSPADERHYADLRRAAREDRRLTILDESFSSNEVHGLISVCDCYVALHRSEGFGFGMAEAMKLGVPVIATGYSGNADFTTEATAWPVRWRLVPVPGADFVYEEEGQAWADPDLEHAAERMRQVRDDPDRDAKRRRARELVARTYDEASVGRAYRERIEAIRAGLRAMPLAAGGGGR